MAHLGSGQQRGLPAEWAENVCTMSEADRGKATFLQEPEITGQRADEEFVHDLALFRGVGKVGEGAPEHPGSSSASSESYELVDTPPSASKKSSVSSGNLGMPSEHSIPLRAFRAAGRALLGSETSSLSETSQTGSSAAQFLPSPQEMYKKMLSMEDEIRKLQVVSSAQAQELFEEREKRVSLQLKFNHEAGTTVNNFIRTVLAHLALTKSKKAVTKAASAWRRLKARGEFMATRCASMLIQRSFRGHLVRARLSKEHRAARTIQDLNSRVIRQHQLVRKLRVAQRKIRAFVALAAAVKIQAVARMTLASKNRRLKACHKKVLWQDKKMRDQEQRIRSLATEKVALQRENDLLQEKMKALQSEFCEQKRLRTVLLGGGG